MNTQFKDTDNWNAVVLKLYYQTHTPLREDIEKELYKLVDKGDIKKEPNQNINIQEIEILENKNHIQNLITMYVMFTIK